MSLILGSATLEARQRAAAGELATLVDALSGGLEPLLGREHSLVPLLEAQLSREGGRCSRDGTLLDFDPWRPDAHRCPRCGTIHTGERHHRHWLYWYHLWLAERVLHAALLWRLRGGERHRGAAVALLDAYAARYPHYANRANLLGPSRVFFSTYLESIWLLQLVLAADLLREGDDGTDAAMDAVLQRFRDRVVEPSVELIASFGEGASNRQVWNGAALMAAGAALGRDELVEQALYGASGLVSQLRTGLLADGSWYEGENYHLFAHRGLWYGVTLAESLGAVIPADALARYEAGFRAPLATVLPDLTLPSRRDSQYAISLRQPRFAEMAELGFARTGDPALASLLHALYASEVPGGVTGQHTSTADVERNVAPTALSRADLGWRALAAAAPALPPAASFTLHSALLPSQGIAVLRRQRGKVYAALDYGASGGGHGHPDRLNLLLMDGTTRWLDDVGTGSYVERTLHWYRSTLAHNAPLVDGRSQQRVDGTLVAHEEQDGAGWVVARAEIAPGVTATRSVVVMEEYLLDELQWSADRDVQLDLPFHLHDATEPGDARRSAAASLSGGSGLEDGFEFLSDTRVAPLVAGELLQLQGERDGSSLRVFLTCGDAAEWWRARTPPAPPAPGVERAGTPELHLLRQHGSRGSVRSVFSWTPGVRAVFADGEVHVTLPNGVTRVHSTPANGTEHRVTTSDAGIALIVLGGAQASSSTVAPRTQAVQEELRAEPVARLAPIPHDDAWFADSTSGSGWFVAELGERHYRRSEQSWREAGEPAARVAVSHTGAHLLVDIAFSTPEPLRFAPADAVNPYDNEHPDLDGHGVQLYVRGPGGSGGWILVPGEAGEVRVRALGRSRSALVPRARWRGTTGGFELRAELAVAELAPQQQDATEPVTIALDVLVNETARGRERRRGQLVLSGGGDWLYLRGDRHDPDRLLMFELMRDPE